MDNRKIICQIHKTSFLEEIIIIIIIIIIISTPEGRAQNNIDLHKTV